MARLDPIFPKRVKIESTSAHIEPELTVSESSYDIHPMFCPTQQDIGSIRDTQKPVVPLVVTTNQRDNSNLGLVILKVINGRESQSTRQYRFVNFTIRGISQLVGESDFVQLFLVTIHDHDFKRIR
jgi:hypothetical protein